MEYDFIDSFTQRVEHFWSNVSLFREPLDVVIEFAGGSTFKRCWMMPEEATRYGD